MKRKSLVAMILLLVIEIVADHAAAQSSRKKIRQSIQLLVDLARESAKVARPIKAGAVLDYSFLARVIHKRQRSRGKPSGAKAMGLWLATARKLSFRGEQLEKVRASC